MGTGMAVEDVMHLAWPGAGSPSRAVSNTQPLFFISPLNASITSI